MSVLNMSKANDALKLFYLPSFQYQLNNANALLAQLERDTNSVFGSEIRMALRYGRHGGIGNRADDADLPTPNSRKTKQASWDTKNIFAQIQVSDKTMRASRNSAGAFAALLEADLEDAKTDAVDNVSRQVFGNGQGKLGTLTANAASSPDVVIDTPQFVSVGQYVDIIAADGVTVKTTASEVLNVNRNTGDVTLDQSVVVVAGDFLVISGNLGNELTGLADVLTTGNTLYGIDRSANSWFDAVVSNNVGTLSEVAIQAAIDDADVEAGGVTNFLIGSHGVRRAYQNLLTSTKRTVNSIDLEGGFKALDYNGMPFTVDKYAPKGSLAGLDLNTWKVYHIMDWQWLDDDGAILSRVPGKAVWSATLARYMDLGCSKPKGNFIMNGITEQ